MDTNQNVLIVGSGPTGLTLGCRLLQFGIDCQIIEARDSRLKRSKAFALHARTVELMDMLGIGDQIREKSLPVTRFIIHSGRKPLFSFDFSLIHSDQNINRIFSFPQYQLEDALEQKYLALGGKITYGAKLIDITQDDSSVSAKIQVDNESMAINSSFLVGCDGAHSTTRGFTTCKMEGHSYDNTFVVADGTLESGGIGLDIDLDAGHTFVSRDGYTMLFPLPGGKHRVVIDGNPDSKPLDNDDFHNALTDRGFEGLRFQSIDWLSNAVLNAKVADNYTFNRVILAGDACHVHSPIGGQGINLGAQDSFNLAWKLSLIFQHNMHADVLSTYSEERRIVAKNVIANTDKLHNMLVSSSPLASLARKSFLPLMSKTPSSQRRIVADLSGITTSYRSIYSSGKSSSLLRKGDRIPNATLFHEHGTTTLYDLINKPQYTIILVSQDGRFGDQHTNAQEDIILLSPKTSSSHNNVYQVQDSPLASIHPGKSGTVCLVARPDGHLQHIETVPADSSVDKAISFVTSRYPALSTA
jgi:2-polyprenyl-6-methoxyphenol hydroxylase-like FAD-dependent oxidoreductase